MPVKEFTLDDLRRILLAGAGADDAVDLNADIADTDFEELGYESLAMLETSSRIEREFGVRLDDAAVFDAHTPRALIEVVTSHLRALESA